MLAYWLMLVIFATGAIVVRDRPGAQSQSRPVLFLAAVLLTAFIGLRYQVGPDWSTYVDLYKYASRLDLAEVISHDDPGFYALMWLGRWLHLEVWALNLSCAAIFTSGLLAFARRQPNPWLTIAAAFPYLVMVVAMSGVRQATAIGFIFLGLAAFLDKKLYRFMFWVMCASLFHASALLMAVVVGLSYTRNRLQSIVLLCIATYPAYYILSASFEVYIHRYADESLQSEGTIYRVMMNFVPAVYLLFNLNKFTVERHEQVLWRNLAFVAIVCVPLMLFVPSSTALDRISLYVIPLQIYALSRIPTIISSNSREYLLSMTGLLIFLGMVMFVYLQFSVHGKYYIPYRLYPLF
ncbi:MAG TPA: EpsG family protein [Sphingomicrobium sp.]|nr:EpsG family protein [Sphingomicrobium sp.]